MVDFFFSREGDHYFFHLPNAKKAQGACLKTETLKRIRGLESADGKETMPEAEMRESPALGRWPATMDSWREDIAQQRIELLGLAFAVDVCLGYPRIWML
jgi:hypothetical protein